MSQWLILLGIMVGGGFFVAMLLSFYERSKQRLRKVKKEPKSSSKDSLSVIKAIEILRI